MHLLETRMLFKLHCRSSLAQRVTLIVQQLFVAYLNKQVHSIIPFFINTVMIITLSGLYNSDGEP